MKFWNNYQTLSKAQKETLLTLFRDWIIVRKKDGKNIIYNLKNDKFLSNQDMNELLVKMISLYDIIRKGKQNPHLVIPSFEEEINNKLFDTKLRLRGNQIKSTPLKIGTVVPVKKFNMHMRLNHYETFGIIKPKRMKKIMNSLQLYMTKTPLRDCFIKNKNYLIWFTWNESERNHNSFPFLERGCSSEFCIALGLSSQYRDKIYAFTFDRIKLQHYGAAIYRPTFCDARFNPGFKASSIDLHGLTFPVRSSEYSEYTNPMLFKRRPEGIEISRRIKIGYCQNITEYAPL